MIVCEKPLIRMFNADSIRAMGDMVGNSYDLAITDPEYGIGESSRVRSKTGTHRVKQKNGKYLVANCDTYKKKRWDDKPPPDIYFERLFRVSRHQIIWGINNFSVDVGPGRIFWDKVNPGNDFSDGELAFCSLHDSVRMIRYMWNGMMQGKSLKEGWIQQGDKSKNEKRIHPTQKPILLYKWLLGQYAKQGFRILDTHGGSASIVIACWEMGFNLDWWEIDPDYYSDAVNRFKKHIKQPSLFNPETGRAKPEQLTIGV